MKPALDGGWVAGYDSVCRRLLRSVPALATGDVHETVINYLEYRLITAALAEMDGNQIAAARLLGIHRNTLRRKMAQYRGVFDN